MKPDETVTPLTRAMINPLLLPHPLNKNELKCTGKRNTLQYKKHGFYYLGLKKRELVFCLHFSERATARSCRFRANFLARLGLSVVVRSNNTCSSKTERRTIMGSIEEGQRRNRGRQIRTCHLCRQTGFSQRGNLRKPAIVAAPTTAFSIEKVQSPNVHDTPKQNTGQVNDPTGQNEALRNRRHPESGRQSNDLRTCFFRTIRDGRLTGGSNRRLLRPTQNKFVHSWDVGRRKCTNVALPAPSRC